MKKLTTDQFIKQFYQRYPDGLFLDLLKFEYSTARSQSVTICKIHNVEILNSANCLMQGIKRCKQCKSEAISKTQAFTINQFIEKSKNSHGGKYDYSLVDYKGSQNKVKIVCDKHGAFFQTPELHMNGYGCKKCGYKSLRKSVENFILESNEIHNEQYDYSNCNYDNNYTPVEVICKIHGPFRITPVSHTVYQRGCPDCYLGNRSWIETRWLNELGVPHDCRQTRVKIGNKSFLVDGKIGNTIYEFWGDFWHGNPEKFSPDMKNTKCGKTFKELYEKTMNKRQLIKDAGFQLIEIWESEYKLNGILKCKSLL